MEKNLVAQCRRMIKDAGARARKKGKPFDIDANTVKKLWIHQKGMCALSGVVMKFGSSPTKHMHTMSLDCIQPTGGYVEGNIQLLSQCVNVAKSTLSIDEFKEMCTQVSFYGSGSR